MEYIPPTCCDVWVIINNEKPVEGFIESKTSDQYHIGFLRGGFKWIDKGVVTFNGASLYDRHYYRVVQHQYGCDSLPPICVYVTVGIESALKYAEDHPDEGYTVEVERL